MMIIIIKGTLVGVCDVVFLRPVLAIRNQRAPRLFLSLFLKMAAGVSKMEEKPFSVLALSFCVQSLGYQAHPYSSWLYCSEIAPCKYYLTHIAVYFIINRFPWHQYTVLWMGQEMGAAPSLSACATLHHCAHVVFLKHCLKVALRCPRRHIYHKSIVLIFCVKWLRV